MKTSENLWFSDVSRAYRDVTLDSNGLKSKLCREYLKKYAEYLKDSYKVEINIISIFMPCSSPHLAKNAPPPLILLCPCLLGELLPSPKPLWETLFVWFISLIVVIYLSVVQNLHFRLFIIKIVFLAMANKHTFGNNNIS